MYSNPSLMFVSIVVLLFVVPSHSKSSAKQATAAAVAPHIVLVVADDLGYNDLGYKNQNKTITPNIDGLVRDGVVLSQYYTYKLCSPTRSSIQSGRYPWGVGFYDMDDSRFGDSFHCIHPNITLMPALLKKQGYATHAIGKWDVGYIEKHCLPTYRGYDTFLGYYTACTSDYWYHGAPGGNLTYSKCGGVDFHDSVGDSIKGATMNGPDSLNNTYDQEVFTTRATNLIKSHPKDTTPFFLYLAYHNVHDTCQGGGGDRLGLNAPLDTVKRYSHTKLDIWKVQGAMTTELDYGIGNVTEALYTAGMYDNSVIIMVSDNGGPLGHSNNAPLRGGKGQLWEGGVRVEAWVHSPLINVARRGTTWPGLAHSSDWYVTLVEGIAGAAPGTATTGTGNRAPDGHNLWPALVGANLTSPRTEVIHRVNNQYFNPQLGDSGSVAARFGEMKIIGDWNCDGNDVWQAWPELSTTPIEFGESGGELEAGTDHCRAASISEDMEGRGGGRKSNRSLIADPTCATGIKARYHNSSVTVCCPKSCGECGVASECQLPIKNGKPCPCAGRPGGAEACCVTNIQDGHRWCSTNAPPCIVAEKSKPFCLYNLTADPFERNNLGKDPKYADLINDLALKLQSRGATGPPLASAFPADIGMKNSTASAQSCQQENKTGYLEYLGWTGNN